MENGVAAQPADPSPAADESAPTPVPIPVPDVEITHDPARTTVTIVRRRTTLAQHFWTTRRMFTNTPSFSVTTSDVVEHSIPGKIVKTINTRALPASLPAQACVCAAYHWSSVYIDVVVIVGGYLTLLCKSKGEVFKDMYPDDLLARILKAVIEKTNVNLSQTGDVVLGSVLAPGSHSAVECRMPTSYGAPEIMPIRMLNRQQRLSGLQAVADVAAAIKTVFCDIEIGAGLEPMRSKPIASDETVNLILLSLVLLLIYTLKKHAYHLLPVGVTSENAAHRFSMIVNEQDQPEIRPVITVVPAGGTVLLADANVKISGATCGQTATVSACSEKDIDVRDLLLKSLMSLGSMREVIMKDL